MRMLIAAVFALSASSLLAADVDTSDIKVGLRRVFPEVQVKRPVVVTHANDDSGRVFIASQLGKIHVLKNDEEAEDSDVFLDIADQVVYFEKKNEEGLLGLAFHPKYKENGQFFVYYTTTTAPLVSVISRFTVTKNDPNKADPKSEEEILRIPQPYWNHNGGRILFGPDGYLYIGLGDGGSRNDPHGNGQNLKTWLGSILRIDIDRKEGGRGYAIPKDNPFVGRKDAMPEIYAYGIRNAWGMGFDKETDLLWIGDVGQKLWEEINIIRKGGNYGWSVREGFHKFGPKGVGPRKDLIEPIWEYPHEEKQGTIGGQWGESITGGRVYRGKAMPHLNGYYVYADYVTGKVYALKYDGKSVSENRSIPGASLPVMAFGEDADGEIYYTTPIGAIFKLAPSEE